MKIKSTVDEKNPYVVGDRILYTVLAGAVLSGFYVALNAN